MQALKSLYMFSITAPGNIRKIGGGFLYAQLVLGTGDKIRIYVKAVDIINFAKKNVEVVLVDKTNAEKIKLLLPTSEVNTFNELIKEKKIVFEK